MGLTKRDLLKGAGVAGVGAAIAGTGSAAAQIRPGGRSALTSMTSGAVPISADERRGRIARAQGLMGEAGIDAILIEPGAAMTYFSGVQWRRSERLTALVIPAVGDVSIVTPYFEEPSVRESLAVDGEVRTWHEHEDPLEVVAGILADGGARAGRIGLEETVRYFVADGLGRLAPQAELVSGANVVRGCRMFKSSAEIALMQMASDVVMAAYAHVAPQIVLGMTNTDISQMMTSAMAALGARPGFGLVLLGEASAYPHGTGQPQSVEQGGVVLMDCGCTVEGYQADISRTMVFGEPSAKQREVWDTVKRGQELALETAQVGTPAGRVDDVVRGFYESLGYGPDYATPGLSHRLGHGIGMEGHEPVNFVRGEETLLQPGMCFSNEPGVYIYGEFGVRLEDCLYMTEDGPVLFSKLAESIDKPVG